ncbi:serine/threonine protein kinase [Desulfopila aestuarii]|uniref:Stress response kinase A n=1 Tax=Desulfopila aestuarii DSM 18488 TaxID=1121416 RepID=A0A1M7Y5X8_9BACT|nr:serine/threonine protein kinase [Desulfopila aestuarii]SHO47895.1 Ser/Thr protein kinase RdoA involved in Cpx stress response, MazF antagonist [Desulfopila aestuarii DSM 18488]
MQTDDIDEENVFQDLGPDMVLSLVERSLNVSLTNLFRPLNSYINRVYELQKDDGGGLIVKFYRPGRWTGDALQEEHDFLLELAGEEIPVIAPLKFPDSTTLGLFEGVHFAVFPKRGGRSVDEFDEDQWLQLGRLLGRVHLIGENRSATYRPVMSPSASTRQQLDYLLAGSVVPEEVKNPLKRAVEEIIAETEPLFAGQRQIRIHGDCHFANIIYRPGESFYLIDFDDMVMGPPVQDIWMLLPGTLDEAFVEMDILLEGYETFRPFDRRSFKLIEPLRAMRFVHYMAWCAHQVAADGHTRVLEDFGTQSYWQKEIADLHDQLERIREGYMPLGNML